MSDSVLPVKHVPAGSSVDLQSIFVCFLSWHLGPFTGAPDFRPLPSPLSGNALLGFLTTAAALCLQVKLIRLTPEVFSGYNSNVHFCDDLPVPDLILVGCFA